MTKYVIYTENKFGSSKSIQKPWVGKFAFRIFPKQHIFIENKSGTKELKTFLNKLYIFKNGDRVYSSIIPSGGGGILGGISDLLSVANPVWLTAHPFNYKLAFKKINSGVRKITHFLMPDINDPNFERDDRRNRPTLEGSSNTISSDVVPWLFGETLMTPYYGQRTYRLVQDGSSLNKLYQYFICGMNNFEISNEKLGKTPITDYSIDTLERKFALGGTANLSNPSIVEIDKAEQLSYDKDKIVNQSSSFIYNESVNNNTLDYDFILEFRNTVPTDWSDKTFRVEITYYKNGDETTVLTATQDFTVLSGDLILVSGKTYNYTNNFSTVLGGSDVFTTILETRVFPTGSTRNTSSEISQELECELDEETVTCGSFTETTQLNNPINNYVGVVSAVVDTSPTNTRDIDFVFSFPQGMYKQQNDGSRTSRTTKVDIQIKTQTGEYKDISEFNIHVRDENGNANPLSSSSTTVSGSEVTFTSPDDIKQADELFYRTIGISGIPDKYTVRIRSADFSDKTNFDIGYPQVEFINYWLNENSVNSQIFPKVTQINLIATASKELSGTLQQYNFLARGILPVWNGTDWNTKEFTQNPASIIRYALLNDLVNARAEEEEIIDNDSLVELYEWCELQGFKVSGAITQQYKVESFLGTILDTCQATWTFYRGKFYFGIDKPKNIRQMFTPHNTYNFTYSPNIGKNVTAIRTTYLDGTDWNDKEITMYYYDGDVHELPKINTTDEDYQIIKQQVDFVTDVNVVKKMIDYRLRQIQERRDNFSFSVNLENINLRILDRIYVANTSNMQNSSTGQIKELITSGGNITGFRLYSKINIPDNAKITIRSLDTNIEEISINTYEVANSGEYDIIELTTPIVNTGVIQGKGIRKGLSKYTNWEYDGDLFEIGQDDIVECVIDEIKPNSDLTATIICREA